MQANSIEIPAGKKIGLVISILAGLGGITAFLLYIERRSHRKIEEEVLVLDKNIKELQLQKLKQG